MWSIPEDVVAEARDRADKSQWGEDDNETGQWYQMSSDWDLNLVRTGSKREAFLHHLYNGWVNSERHLIWCNGAPIERTGCPNPIDSGQ